MVAAGKGKTLAAEKMGKLKTVIQLTCISIYLAKIAFQSDGQGFFSSELQTQVIDILLWGGQLTLIAATLLTVFSGIVYLTKYWKFFIAEES